MKRVFLLLSLWVASLSWAQAFVLPWQSLTQKGTSPLSCLALLDRIERLYQIPRYLLTAIALTESGRSFRSARFIPWPWTINVNGKGYFFRTKEEAIQATRDFQGKGIRSIDVGCMQINLHHHPRAFESLEEAFDPTINIRYGAQFLRRLKAQKGDWHAAIAHYHSANPMYNGTYRQRVLRHWQNTLSSPPVLPESSPSQKLPLIPLMRAHLSGNRVLGRALRPSPQVPQTIQETTPLVRVSSCDLKRAGQALSHKVKQSLLGVSRSTYPTGHAPDIKKTLPLRLSYSATLPHLRPRLIASSTFKTAG